MSQPSGPYTVRMHAGVHDVLTQIRQALAEQHAHLTTADDYEELCDMQRQLLTRICSYVRCLTQLHSTTPYDGDEIHILPDHPPHGLFFRYPKSGYHGAMVPDEQGWGIHT